MQDPLSDEGDDQRPGRIFGSRRESVAGALVL